MLKIKSMFGPLMDEEEGCRLLTILIESLYPEKKDPLFRIKEALLKAQHEVETFKTIISNLEKK